MKHKLINRLLLITFIITIMVPLTGIVIHKMASTLFLILCIIHTVLYRKSMNAKKYLVLGSVFLAFISGIFGMIFDEIPMILALHKAISIIIVFMLAIHIYLFHKRMGIGQRRTS